MRGKVVLSRDDRIFYTINGIILCFFFIITLYPLVFLISSSVSEPTAVAEGRVTLFPVGFSLKGYIAVFKNKNILTGYGNSFFYTVAGTVLNIIVTMLTAFSLSRKEMPGRQAISFLFAFTMWFSGGLIPSYLLMRSLGFLNSRLVMIIPGLISVWNVIVCRTYFQNTIPEELYESATIDGCGYFRFFLKITLPLSGAIIAVMTLFYAVGHWNAYFSAMIYLNDRKLFPLQIFLREILIQNTVDASTIVDEATSMADVGLVELLKYSLIMVACVPLWLVYPFVQKSFVKGVMVGSLKG